MAEDIQHFRPKTPEQIEQQVRLVNIKTSLPWDKTPAVRVNNILNRESLLAVRTDPAVEQSYQNYLEELRDIRRSQIPQIEKAKEEAAPDPASQREAFMRGYA